MLEKKYEHKKVEENKYKKWIENKYFESGDKSKKPFSIVIPPPNVTGKLHLGHAWDTTLQDIIIRYKRLQGFDALWLPGMDHAGIATQAKVDAKLKSEGIVPREMDRSAWLEKAWEWKDVYSKNIRSQWAKLGLSLDYSKERFTLDEGLSDAVNKVFIDLYNKGLIYRGERIINWDPASMTALSNEEVIHKEVEGAFYHIKYYIEDTDKFVVIATTRPETLFGDTAVAVNPKDERYKDLIGKNVILPIANKKIPVVADDYVDREFGTGIVKITPAHDVNDFEVGNRHNLERIICINKNGTMNQNALEFEGMDRFECRKALIEKLNKVGQLEKIEKHIHSVGHSERTDVIVEPYLSKQWFVKMRPLADKVLDNQKDKENKVNFIPERFEKIMNHWMEITYDWCISRQLWWGHQIPAWYKDDEAVVSVECPGEGYVRDTDVLDTWFSSALWPFSTLGWPEDTEDMKRYYPNNCLVTGYDIIPFWVNRMTFQGLEFTGTRPFKDCLIHGLIRDQEGRKMSKSLGNGVDPMDVIEEYGADSLRFFLSTASSLGQDLRYEPEKVASTWNFINKIWNASNYVMSKEEKTSETNYIFDNWILYKFNNLKKEVTKLMDKYTFNIVGDLLTDFIWNDFCDWYIEFSKVNLNTKILKKVLEETLIMLNPFMPYVTDEIYKELTGKEISLSEYPKSEPNDIYITDYKKIEELKEIIIAIRNFKAENNVFKDYSIETNIDLVNENKETMEKLLKCDFNAREGKVFEIKFKAGNIKITYKPENEEDLRIQIEKEIEELGLSIEKRKKLLSNENYVTKAPENVVNLDKEKLKIEEEKLKTLSEQLQEL